ncbi:MAG: BrxA/BrxB family bacilliredoxin [Cytophagales bacterium]|nr:BrxA/BrxB family bacilliredoxin [Bernardetiaceae bacterium]MDW8210664.1 BrxA/BrxB family bacilliredoxin [Cytophagales bacterium]
MYPKELTDPMKQELIAIGFEDLDTPEKVEAAMKRPGVTMVVVNSVCGCAAGAARPGVRLALQQARVKPDHLVTVFAGVDKEAVAKAREYMLPYPPSSPSIAIFKDGDLMHFIQRHEIEGRTAEMIAEHLVETFEELCTV